MELWSLLIFLLTLGLAAALGRLLHRPSSTLKSSRTLPPGPPAVPFLGNLLWMKRSLVDLESILRNLRREYGPIITLRLGRRSLIFISDHSLAHNALVQQGSTFADRPIVSEAGRLLNSNHHNISSSAYGPLWRLLRRNLTSEILHPARVKTYSQARKWVLDLLKEDLGRHACSGEPVCAVESFQHAMFCLLLLMCFGRRLDDDTVRNIEATQRRFLLRVIRTNFFAFFPDWLGKLIFRKTWKELLQIRHDQKQHFVPLIRARKDRNQDDGDDSFVFCYVDSLLSLELPEEGGRKLTEDEMVTLCSEFLTAGTDTTSTALQWIMANLVKRPDLQQKLVEEIEGVVGKGEEEVREELLGAMQYLKAVVMEGLRRHPPGHFVLPHAVSKDVMLGGYEIPKGATVNFTVGDMALDGKVWEDPLAFRPERFLAGGEGSAVDITGNKEIKMMPFGAGRRICPGLNLALLHLEYFVANLVKDFQWTPADGEEVDLSEKPEFTVVMKNPLKAKIRPRR